MKVLAFSSFIVGMAAAGHSTVQRSCTEYLPLTDSGRTPAKAVDRNPERYVRVLAGPRAPTERPWRLLSLWQHRSRTHHQLGDLDDHSLKDIGLSRCEWFIETSRPGHSPRAGTPSCSSRAKPPS
jgi:uncharacterized protein YjiS (DUF1127 family)